MQRTGAQIVSGNASDWQKSSLKWKGVYTSQWAEAGTLPVVKQYVGDFITTTGFEVHMRDMGTYNDTLFGDVLSDFNLQSNDVLLVSAIDLEWAFLRNVAVACLAGTFVRLFNRRDKLPCWQCYFQASIQRVMPCSRGPSGLLAAS